MNVTTPRNVGMNKGTPRIWLEGVKLAQAGFKRHVCYSVDIKRVQIILTLCDNGEKRVSGKRVAPGSDDWTPVIDLHNSALVDFLQGSKRVDVTYQEGKITIRRIEV